MFTDYKAKGIVFEQEARGEADKRFILFSKEFGRLEVVGKSIRKIDSKLKGGITLFSLSNIEFIQARHYKILTFSEIEKEFEGIMGSSCKLRTAYQVRDIIGKLITEPEADLQIWHLILEVFMVLNNSRFTTCPAGRQVYDLRLLYHFFAWRLLSLLGRQPELFLCLRCRGKLKPGNLYFSMHGGILCQDCRSKAKRKESAIEISIDTIKLLREIGQRPFSFIKRINAKRRHLEELDKALNLYLS